MASDATTKASLPELDDRFWGTTLVVIGMVAMSVSIYMNGRFGWSLMVYTPDRIAMVTVHILVDLAASGLAGAGGNKLARRQRWSGGLAMFCSVVLVAYSMVSVYGFMSPRIHTMQVQRAVLGFEKDQLTWLRGQTVNSELRHSEKRAMAKEVAAQISEIKKTVGMVTDSQATSIADTLATFQISVGAETVQKILVMISSGMAQAIKFTCQLFGFFFMAHRRKSSVSLTGSDGSSGSKIELRKLTLVGSDGSCRDMLTGLPQKLEPRNNVRSLLSGVNSTDALGGKLTTNQFNELMSQLAQGGSHPSTRAIAAATGWSQRTVARRLARLKAHRDAMG